MQANVSSDVRVMEEQLWGCAFAFAFVFAMVVNGLSASGIGVPLTNKGISDAHPVYLTPMAFAFGVWGVIYIFWLLFAIVQLLPSAVRDPLFSPLRPLATLAMALNAAWLVLFAYGYFLIALVVIATYLLVLYRLVALTDVNFVTTLAFVRTSPGAWRRIVAHLAIASNASWLVVATLLQLQVALLDEGWAPTESFSTALVTVVIFVACYHSYAKADLVWAAVAAWALLTIGVNQRPNSGWGCFPQICAACSGSAKQRICTRAGPDRIGWADACSEGGNKACAFEKSETLMYLTYAGAGLVALALLAGIIKGALDARKLRHAMQPGASCSSAPSEETRSPRTRLAEGDTMLSPGRPGRSEIAAPGA